MLLGFIMAQSASLKSPIGVPFFWESGANPGQEWTQWFSTFKLAVMAKENLKVDKLLRTKPTPADLFYPAMPKLKDPTPNESEEETKKRDIMNARRKTVKQSNSEDLTLADTRGRSRHENKEFTIYLNWTRRKIIYHQNNPHRKIDTCSTYQFAHELTITFTKPRNTTYDRFQIMNAKQEPHESLETFYSRLRELGAKAAFGAVEKDLVKDFFIGKMNNTAIQMELLSKMRTPAQVLNYALAREREDNKTKKRY